MKLLVLKILTLKELNKIVADNILIFLLFFFKQMTLMGWRIIKPELIIIYYYFPEKIRLDILYKSLKNKTEQTQNVVCCSCG